MLCGQDSMLTERYITLFGRDIKLSEQVNYVVGTRYYVVRTRYKVVRTRYLVVITTELCCSNKMISCANKILSRSNSILSRRIKVKNKTRMSLPGFRTGLCNHGFVEEHCYENWKVC